MLLAVAGPILGLAVAGISAGASLLVPPLAPILIPVGLFI